MSDATPLCRGPRCSHPSPNGFLCRSCLERLKRELLSVDELVDDLLTTITRQDALERRGTPDPELERRTLDTGGAAVTPLPIRPDPAEAGRDLHGVLGSWVRHLTESRGIEWRPVRGAALGPLPPSRFPSDDTVDVARWLARHLETIAADEAAGELDDEVRDAIRRARDALDVRELLALGPCNCSPTQAPDYCPREGCGCGGTHGPAVHLYAPPDAPFVTCRECGASFGVRERRDWLLDRARDQLLTATDMSRALPRYLEAILEGRPLTAAMIRGYAHRGAIRAYVPDPRDWYVSPATGMPVRPEPRYRVGDVIDHLTRIRTDRQAELLDRTQRDTRKANR